MTEPTDAEIDAHVDLFHWDTKAGRRDLVRAALACWRGATTAQGDALDAAFDAVRQRLCGLQRYSFVLDDDGMVRRVQDRTGNWIEFDAAHELFDPVAVDAARSQAANLPPAN